jgi:tetratricopeptide (TPR) repeat protein
LVERPVLSGQIPPVAVSYLARQETGLTSAALPAGTTTALVSARATARELGGLGGTGKTSLACALAREHYDNQAAHLVLWVAATGRDAVITGYAQALRDLGEGPYQGESPEHAADRFLDWLKNTGEPWLVVLDEIAGPAAVDGLWPVGSSGKVLVTSQQPDAAAGAYDVRAAELGAFSPREALTYLFASLQLDPGQRVGALELATDLGFSPVALRHAAAFLNATTLLDCRQYQTHFTERRRLAVPAFGDGMGATVAATWSLSCELADQLAPPRLAGWVLALISMLSPHGIPYGVLASQAARAFLADAEGPLSGETDVRAALGNLARAGLVTVNQKSPSRTVLVHEIVQALTRQHLQAAEAERVARAAADALAQAWSDRDMAPSTAQALRDCTAKLRENTGAFLLSPQCHPAVMRAGQSLDADGLAGPAVAYWHTMAGATQQVLGARHPQTIVVRNHLGAACEASGRHDEAIAIYEAAIADREQALGSDHPDTLAARDRLISTYLAAGRVNDAISSAEKRLGSPQAVTGRDHAATLTAQANLASVYLRADRPDEAIVAFQNVLAKMGSVYGPDHPETIAIHGRLADAFRESGRFKDAIALGKRILADRERVDGPDDPGTMAARASLASAYRDANKPKDAIRHYERILADRERVQGPDHSDTILARCDLAAAYTAARKFGLAIPQYERALTDSERALGYDHPITQSVREDLGKVGAYALSVLGIELRTPRSVKEKPQRP